MANRMKTIISFFGILSSTSSIRHYSTCAAFIQSSPTTTTTTPFTTMGRNNKNTVPMNSASSSSSSSSESWDNIGRDNNEQYNSNSPLDAYPLQPLRQSQARQQRILRERQLKEKYVQGDELIKLRSEIRSLKMELRSARNSNSPNNKHDTNEVKRLEELVRYSQSRDAAHVYGKALDACREAMLEGRRTDADDFRQVAMDAKSCMPQFNLEGLWVGKYGKHGYEMINVTYTDDTLIAYKVTGDKNVPKGEITFTADLNPDYYDYSETSQPQQLEPIELSENAAKQWGIKHLIRFPGHGQVASEGFVKKEWVDGQLLMIGNYFSFAWVPLGHQIFFGRPSPELILRLLRESEEMSSSSKFAGRNEDENVAKMRNHVTKCLEETMVLEEDEEMNSRQFYSSMDGFEECGIDDCFQ